MIQIDKFKVSFSTMTKSEQNKAIYAVLKRNPQGLLLGELMLLSGAGTYHFVNKVLKRIKKKTYARDLGARHKKMYYARIHAKKLIKFMEKYQ